MFTPSPDPAISLWRFLDFTKFVDVLERRALFFSRADLLGDPFEGSLTAANHEWLVRICADMKIGLEPVEQRRALLRRMRSCAFVSCWHENQHESAAMWRLYARSNEAVAIRTTFGRLRAAWGRARIECGRVRYIDYTAEMMPEGNIFWPLMHKRRSFGHEQEVRAVLVDWDRLREPSAVDPRPGEYVPVDLEQLLAAVVVAPTCPRWFHELVERVCERYGVTTGVMQSALDAAPFF